MKESLLLQVLEEQRVEKANHPYGYWTSRWEESQFEWESGLAQVVIGVRRSGKSTLCHKVLHQKGVAYGYVDFNDDRLSQFRADDFNLLLSCFYQIYGADVSFLFLDELQDIEGWHLFVNRLLRQGFHVVLTGSNARLLSSELTTYMTGRYNEIRLFPFSYLELCKYKKLDLSGITTKADAVRKAEVTRYLDEGGLPELLNIRQPQTRRTYVDGLIETIVTKDIAKRFRVKAVDSLRRVAHHLINNNCQIIDYKQLAQMTSLQSAKTAQTYTSYLQQAFLIYRLQKFSFKSRERISNEKSYVIDNGFISNRDNVLLGENLGWRLENTVCVELLRRHRSMAEDIYYYKPTTRSKEVDFVVCYRGEVKELVQVAYTISEAKTYKRETEGLIQASQALHCNNLTLISFDESRLITIGNQQIHAYSAVDWLMGKDVNFSKI